jgi:hypothetical protein
MASGRIQQELLSSEIESPRRAMTRSQLVDRILELNPTATPKFLGAFSESSLAHYLEHLCVVGEPGSSWIRRGIAPAIVKRAARG